MKKKFTFILLLSVILSMNVSAETVIIDESREIFDISPYASVLTDKENSLTIDQIVEEKGKGQFKSVKKGLIRFPADDNTYWFRFEVTNNSGQESWILNIDYAPLYDVRIFLRDSTGMPELVGEGGILTKGKGFLLDRSAISTAFNLKRGESAELFIRVDTPSFLILPVEIMSQKAFIQKNNRKLTLLWFLFGIVFAAAIFNLFLFFQTREFIYFLLSLVISLFILLALYQYGFDVFPGMTLYLKERLRLFFFGLLMTSLSYLTIHYLELKKFRNWLRILSTLILMFLAYTLMVLLPFVPHLLMIKLTPWMNSLAIIVIFTASIHAYRKKVKSAIHFIIYNVSFLLSSVIWVLFLYDILPLNLFTRFTSLESVSVFSILVTLGLSEKITAIKKEKEKSAMFSSLNEKLRIEIEERKKTEAALRESEEKFRLLFDFSPQPILVTDLATGNIEQVNNSLSEMYGRHAGEMTGNTSLSIGLLNEDERTKLVNEVKANGYSRGLEVEIESSPGKIRHIILQSTSITLQGKEKLITILSDITDKKEQIKVLRESELRLIELNATKDRFYSIIGHDLMDPFNALIGFSDILEEAIRNDKKEESLEYIAIVQESVDRIFNLLQSLLLWSRSQSGRITFRPVTINLNGLMNETLQVAYITARNKGITIRQEMEENLQIMGDSHLLGTVLRNLVNNAIKFTGRGGSISIRAMVKDGLLQVTVSDTGVGMNSEQLSKMFRIDQRLSTPGTNNEKGNGFGLIICQEFIALHQGKIWAESIPGRGSDFHFTLPLTPIN